MTLHSTNSDASPHADPPTQRYNMLKSTSEPHHTPPGDNDFGCCILKGGYTVAVLAVWHLNPLLELDAQMQYLIMQQPK